MEGITTYIYRNIHNKYFKGVDKYFMPFVSPTMHGSFNPKEKKDVIPEHNQNINVVPQILTNNAEYFIQTAKELKDFGYQEVNLNLGCPSNTVVTKCKGSGFLSETYRLEKFLDTIFSKTDMDISIKTRIGRYEEEEFEELLRIFNHYQMTELIIHPRVQQDYYKNKIHIQCFLDALPKSKNPVCYNGDLNTVSDYENLISQCKELQMVMLGRGVIGNPALIEQIRTGKALDMATFWSFLDELLEAYEEALANNALYKMKELWIYMGNLFPNGDKTLKKIKKAQKMVDYKKAIEMLK